MGFCSVFSYVLSISKNEITARLWSEKKYKSSYISLPDRSLIVKYTSSASRLISFRMFSMETAKIVFGEEVSATTQFR